MAFSPTLSRPIVTSPNSIHLAQRRDIYGAWEQYLGLEHSDTAPKRAYTANQQINIDLYHKD
ncbi:hypothetical protein MUK42_08966 [Musa troglodytarum]|uniref:Uncharacterized protein n=1 Tax=Musa troglodytarum TaxID=320322 RepID=A0A9E7JVF9_9LILI|nr:hypothetical protein MUK42_08966 [Musa troglodytarum]